MKKFSVHKNIFDYYIYFLFFLPVVISGQNSSDKFNLFSPDPRLQFGNYLYNEKDYLRASKEFKEVLKFTNNDSIRFKFANCFFNTGRFQEAADNYKGLFTSSNLHEEAKLAFYKSIFFQNNFSAFRSSIVNEIYLPNKYRNEVNRLFYISYLFDNSTLPDTLKFFSAFPDSNKNDLRQFYFKKKFPEYKNPTTAAILSTILPGLGKIYVGEITDGLTSFLVSSVLTFLTIDNFKHDHKFRGWLFAGLGVYFYAGNIYGSAASAQIFNAGIKFNFEKEVRLYFEKRNYFIPELSF